MESGRAVPSVMPLDHGARAEPDFVVYVELDELGFEPSTDGEPGRVEEWRYECLQRAGYRPDVATVLARRVDVELHLAVSLLESGCSQANALRILL